MGKKVIRFMDTSFRDGFQSVFGARVLTDDFLPAIEATIEAGITHLEAGGGARFQSLFFYCGESAFDMMDSFRATAGPNATLQTLSRGINVVALNQQPRDIIDLHAKLFKKHGMTTIRNFDALNDIRNLRYSGERIDHYGLNHQIVITVMDLPPGCEGSHTTEFYLERLKRILNDEIPFHSICFKDATGTANPNKIFETFKGARKMCPQDTILWFHTHDTAGIGLSQNMAAIAGGADGVDLAKSPVCGGTSQPDILSMIQILKGTDYTMDVDVDKLLTAENIFERAMEEYFFPPEAKMVSPKIILSPMPGGALTANTMMMRDTKTLHLYADVIKEMTETVKLGGFGSSVTPVSQFYFQQAFLNVTMGKWKKINPQYGNMVLGYFGKTPVDPDPTIVKLASEQLKKPKFKGDPLDIIEPGIPAAKKTLKENGLPVTDESIFIIASCEDKGLRFLKGESTVSVRKTVKDEIIQVNASSNYDPISKQSLYSITVGEKPYGVVVGRSAENVNLPPSFEKVNSPLPPPSTPPENHEAIMGRETAEETIIAQIPGKVLKIMINVGENVQKNQTVLVMEAMKMETEIKATRAGKIAAIHVKVDDAVQTGDKLASVK